MDPRFLDLGTSWRWVVSFTPLPLYWYPLDWRLGGPRSRSGRYGEVNILDHTGTAARSRPVYRLSCPGSCFRLTKEYGSVDRFFWELHFRLWIFSTAVISRNTRLQAGHVTHCTHVHASIFLLWRWGHFTEHKLSLRPQRQCFNWIGDAASNEMWGR
jgi:hypothetical protein